MYSKLNCQFWIFFLQLRSRQLLHTTFKIFWTSVLLQVQNLFSTSSQCFNYLIPPGHQTFCSDVHLVWHSSLHFKTDYIYWFAIPSTDIWGVFSEPLLPLVWDEWIWDAQRKAPWQSKLLQILPCFKYRDRNFVRRERENRLPGLKSVEYDLYK